jgi:hypothetical protein
MRASRAPQAARGGAKSADAHAFTSKRSSILSFIVPADGTSAARTGTGDFGASPVFWAALGQAIPLACIGSRGVSECKEQWQIEELIRWALRLALERSLPTVEHACTQFSLRQRYPEWVADEFIK